MTTFEDKKYISIIALLFDNRQQKETQKKENSNKNVYTLSYF